MVCLTTTNDESVTQTKMELVCAHIRGKLLYITMQSFFSLPFLRAYMLIEYRCVCVFVCVWVLYIFNVKHTHTPMPTHTPTNKNSNV